MFCIHVLLMVDAHVIYLCVQKEYKIVVKKKSVIKNMVCE